MVQLKNCKSLRIGIIGMGFSEKTHVQYFADQSIRNGKIAAICDQNTETHEWVGKKLGYPVKAFTDENEFLSCGLDAVIIATPHYSHPDIAEKAFEHGLHVEIEKPAGVYAKQIRRMNEAARSSGGVFTIMLQQRLSDLHQKIKQLIETGMLGELIRVNWITTDWYRPQCYYDQAPWRGTWEGEGGGILMNQCPHQLDMIQWLCGMPSRVYAQCYFGKHHRMETEDEVVTIFEYDNGMTCTLVVSTGEYPGTNRLEIVGSKGQIIAENDKLIYRQLCESLKDFGSSCIDVMGKPKYIEKTIEAGHNIFCHSAITQNWIDAILGKEELYITGTEGLNSVNMSNAAYLSSWLNKSVKIPVDEDVYYNHLKSMGNERRI